MRLKELLEVKGKLNSDIKGLAEKAASENRDFNADEKRQWDEVNAAYDSNESRIAVAQRASEVSGGAPSRLPGSGNGSHRQTGEIDQGRAVSQAFSAWAMHGSARAGRYATPEALASAQSVGVDIHSSILDISICDTVQARETSDQFAVTHPRNRRGLRIGATATNMNVGTNAQGGFTVPPGTLLNRFEMNMLTFGNVRGVSEIIRTNNGESIMWPGADDTGNIGEQVDEEGDTTSTTTSAAPVISRQTWGAYLFSSLPVLISIQLLDDSAFDIPELIGGSLGTRIARIINQKQTTGSGSGTMAGIVTGSAAGVTCVSASEPTADEFIDLFYSVDPAYRANAKWMMHDSTIKTIRKMKDGDGRYLWSAGGAQLGGIEAGTADTFNGREIVPNNDMATIAASAKVALFGDFSRYKVRTVKQLRILRLNELYAKTLQVGFLGFMREDAKLLNAGTNPVKRMTMAA